MYFKFSIIKIIFFIYNIINQISYSYETDDFLFYTIENITDHIRNDENIRYSSSMRIYDESRTLNKTEVLKLKNKYYTHYYCKNDICVELGYDYLSEYVEIPDEKGTIKRYISKSYSYEELKSVWRTVIGLGPDVYFSLNCTSDSQCLTNKCYNNYCVFNEENPIEFCTNIYINLAMFSYDYMYCGKAIGEKCKRNKECGSKRCKKNSCGLPPGGPCDSCVLVGIRNLLYIGIGIITMISIIILLCYCYYFKLNKNLKNNNKKYKKLQNIL